MVVSRRSLRLLLAVLTLFLAAFAYAAPDEDTGVCPQPFSDDGDARPTSIQSLAPAERFIYSVERVPSGTLEVRYHVDGKLHLTEIIDLDKLQLPLTREPKALMRKGDDTKATQVPRRETAAPKGEWAIELLALEPDSVRQLHRLAREGAVIRIELLQGGAFVETLSYAELTARSEALAKKGFTPVFAPAAVSGPGVDSPARTSRVATNEYLESCSECTYDHPCDTECGYDPGKGGPVTCGEQGLPCGGEPTCVSSYTMGEWWGPWTYYSSSYTGWSECLTRSFGGGYRYNEKITTYRRERIRRTRTCPNAPSCDGCYDTDAAISVQYSQSVCYENSYLSCSFPETACCGSWSCSGPISPCTNTFPCW